jgi:hypothetical protein
MNKISKASQISRHAYRQKLHDFWQNRHDYKIILSFFKHLMIFIVIKPLIMKKNYSLLKLLFAAFV